MEDLFGDEQSNQRREPLLDLTSHAFQPKRYIQRVLSGVPHALFEGQLVDKVGQAEKDTGEALKQLIRDNLAVFVNSKDAMDIVYRSDQALFTGEALDGITNSFKGAMSSCEALVQPITATFAEIQKSRKSQDMLDKLFSVLGVPGAIYDCCGAKVAARRAAAVAAFNEHEEESEDSEIEREDGEEDKGNEGGGVQEANAVPPQNVRGSAAGPRSQRVSTPHKNSNSDSNGTADEEDNIEEDEEDFSGAGGAVDDTSVPGLPSKSHGTLENPGGTTNLADIFILAPEEEIYSWYGTLLVRLRDIDARRHHVEEASNYEAAVLHLRRAMMYLEETYSLIDGTMLAGENGDVPRSTPPPTVAGATESRHSLPTNQASGSTTPVTQAFTPAVPPPPATASNLSTARCGTFAYKFSMALLRSALYLCSQLAEELVYANPADTVLIEDTLSMMMDTSIATVKLHHLCGVLRKSMELDNPTKPSLTKLRTQLGGTAGGGGGANAINADFSSSQKMAGNSNILGVASTNNSASGFDVLSPSSYNAPRSTAAATTPVVGAVSGTYRHAPVYQHPVQQFISIVQRQHRHLFHSSAAALLQEANAWMWKSQTDTARGLEKRHRQRELQRKLRTDGVDTADDTVGTFGHTFTNSFMGATVAEEGGFIGNSNDSFFQDFLFGYLDRRGGGGGHGASSPTQQQQQVGRPSSRTGGLNGSSLGFGGGSSGTTGRGGNNTNNNNSAGTQPYVSLVPDLFVTRMLDAFNTPESPFPTTTEFKVGASDMDAVLLSSCLQIRMHAASLLSQLFTRADVESAVMAQATSLNTFALRLCAECVGTLEHVVGSYWGGIATTLHAGVFDFVPNGTLKEMLTELFNNSAKAVNAADDPNGLQRSSSITLGGGGGASGSYSRTPSALDREDSFQYRQSETPQTTSIAGTADGDRSANAPTLGLTMAGVGASSVDPLPQLRYVPTLPQAFQQLQQQADPSAPPQPACLREISVQAVHQMINTSTSTLRSLFLTFINKGVVDGFVGTMTRYRVSDAAHYIRTERLELHAAVLYEILLGQWERMMSLVSDSVLRLKTVMGESSSSTTINYESQVAEVGYLLQELEVLRSTCLRTYLHGIGVLSKAYLTMLPLLQRRTDTSLDARVRSRLSRESVSSSTVHKLLNVLSVVVDRCVPFFTRDAEVFDSVDLFSVKAEDLKDDEDENVTGGRDGAAGRRLRLTRTRRGGAAAATAAATAALNMSPAPSVGGSNTTTNPASDLLAQFHSKLVVESLQDQEELVLALLSHLLLAFVDMLQLKCRTSTTDIAVPPDERERSVVECVADTLSLATTLTPIFMEHLLSPCFFELMARQLPEVASSPAELSAYRMNKQQQYIQLYLSVVEEHCQLAVNAMMNTYLALTQQPITDLVRRQGFVQPLFDWQRVSPHTTIAVRPYIADAITCIARAHETLNTIRQPTLGSAATQRLVAHLVRVFLTAFTSDINVFEMSAECSTNFLILGLTLLEAEALTILKVVDTVVAHAAAIQTSSELCGELMVARESLANFAQALEAYSNSVCESIAAMRGRDGASEAAISLSFLARDKRHERRDGMVDTAVRTLGYMLEAINVELEESTLSSAGLLQMRSSVTEDIVQRLEHRNKGYELRRAKAAQKEQERKDAEKRAASRQRKTATATIGASPAGEAEEIAGRRVVHRRPEGLESLQPTRTDVEGEDVAGAVATPRTAQAHETEASNAVTAASNVFQLAQEQQQKTKARKVRKMWKTAPALHNDGEAPDAALRKSKGTPPSSPPVPPAAVPTETANVTQPAVQCGGNNEDSGAPMRVRPLRQARRGAAANVNDEEATVPSKPRERRTNRFHRSNVV